ncbi:MAG: hypothetical protein JSR67_04510 [Proteobacteria bacterium]|nr:hypothetical protein [Pseudomonadota bacterium]
MNRSDETPHAAALQIPWLVNGTLAAEAAAVLHEHLALCSQCRHDYQQQQQLHAAMNTEDSLVFATEPSFQKLLTRLKTDDRLAHRPAEAAQSGVRPAGGLRRNPASDRRPPAAYSRYPRAVRWLAAAAVVQALGLGLIGWGWYRSQPAGGEAVYTTLTSAPAVSADFARARVYFQPQTSLAELGSVLRSAHAHLVDGPSEADVYTVGFATSSGPDGAGLDARLAILRASPAVVLAEPLGPVTR